jgi:hypothetical protein
MNLLITIDSAEAGLFSEQLSGAMSAIGMRRWSMLA